MNHHLVVGVVKEFIEKVNQDNILFDSHFYKRSKERSIRFKNNKCMEY